MQQAVIRVKEAMETFQEAEFKEWKEHPVTRELFKYLGSKRTELMEMWASGNFMGPSIEEMAIRNAAAQGACSIIEELITLEDMQLREVTK